MGLMFVVAAIVYALTLRMQITVLLMNLIAGTYVIKASPVHE
ncbi:hypothetical protein [Pseudalkalibacillus hwajinpoensis]|nr:hypothetical protein [Pseudalkalibacillus hwajinpoensis]